MDLHFTSAAPTATERAAVDDALDPGFVADRRQRHRLLEVLHAVQDRVGWLSEGAVNYVAERLCVAPADVYGVATFYALFSTKRRPPLAVHLCDDIACLCAGAKELGAALSRSGIAWEHSPCLGLCDRAPAALIARAGDEPTLVQIAPASTQSIVTAIDGVPAGSAAAPQIGGAPLRLLSRVGTCDPESLDAYRAHDGYLALRNAFELGPQGAVTEITASKLLGRGGAAFPTGRKMAAVAAAAARPHYLICNADESEPGTFKDRILMEHDPFAIVEAMTIAAFATGCERGFVYIRGEYPLARQRLANAIAQARAAGLLGDGVMGRGVRFDIEIRRGAGAYICGEETALFNSIEGKRGEPRNKPPFPVEAGLFGKPTLVNNVETLANIPIVLREGSAAYARTGTGDSTGTRLFCLSGAIARPGLYEIPHGESLGSLIELAGGVAQGSTLQAILLGGAAGTMLSPQATTIPLSFEGARANGATLGSGVVMLFDRQADLVEILRRIARFFRDESCGQCVPCRVGTVRQEEALERLASRAGTSAQNAGDLVLLDEIGQAMRDASICGLGQTAASAIASAQTNLHVFSPDATR